MTTIEDLRRSALSTQHSALGARDRWLLRMKLAGIAAIILSAFAIVGAIDMSVEQAKDDAPFRAAADRAFWRAWLEARDFDYRLWCPPDDPAAPSVMVIIIENWSDKHALVKTCLRVPEPSALSTQHSALAEVVR